MIPSGIRLEIENVFESHTPEGNPRDLWRAQVYIITDVPEKNKLIKNYEVWASVEYLEDHAKKSGDRKGMTEFALEFIERRFSENDNNCPPENGVLCSYGKCELGNPETFPAKLPDPD